MAKWDAHTGRADLGICLVSGELEGDQLTGCVLKLVCAEGAVSEAEGETDGCD